MTTHDESTRDLRLWRMLFERAGWGIAIGDAERVSIALMNPAFAAMHGYSVDELLNQPVEVVFAPEERTTTLPGHLRRIEREGRARFQSMHVRKDGTRFPVLVDATGVRDPDGRVRYRAVHVLELDPTGPADIEIPSAPKPPDLGALLADVRQVVAALEALVDDDPPEILSLRENERRHILTTLESTRWRVAGARGAARLLGVPPSTLSSRMKKLGISKRPLDQG